MRASGSTRSRVVAGLSVVLASLASLVALAQALTDEDEPVVIGQRHRLTSEVMGEERVVSISLPEGYEEGSTSYPVLYMTDGQWNFAQTAGVVAYLSQWARIPEMIVVAVHNTQRGRDLTPTPDPNFGGTGGAARLLGFFERELLPWVESRYRTTDHRLLWGHSFGGVFTFFALTERPDLFDVYLSAGASLWLAGYEMIDRMESLISRRPDLEAVLYFTAGEGDGGPTEPSNQRLATLLEERAPPGLEWYYVTTEKENHFTNVPVTIQRGLQAAYPIWGMDEELFAAATEGGSAGVRSWLAARERTLGNRFVIPEFEILVVGTRLRGAGRFDAAHEVFDVLVERFPDSGTPYHAKGFVYEAQGELDRAAQMYEQALRIGLEQNEADFQVHRYPTALERVRAASG